MFRLLAGRSLAPCASPAMVAQSRFALQGSITRVAPLAFASPFDLQVRTITNKKRRERRLKKKMRLFAEMTPEERAAHKKERVDDWKKGLISNSVSQILRARERKLAKILAADRAEVEAANQKALEEAEAARLAAEAQEVAKEAEEAAAEMEAEEPEAADADQPKSNEKP